MKYLLIFVLIAYTSALSSTANEQEINTSDVFDPVVPESDPVTLEHHVDKASETVVEVRRRENCTYIYKPVYPVFCHPMAPRDEEGKCRKIVSLQIQCGPVEKKDGKSGMDCIPSPDNSEECFEEDGPIEDERDKR